MKRVPQGGVAICRTCSGVLYRGKSSDLQTSLALHLAALTLFVIAHSFPFISFRLEGREQAATILTGAWMLLEAGMWPLGLLVFLVASVIPGLRLAGLIWVLSELLAGQRGRATAVIFRLVELLHPWAMMEVYLLGVIVAYVKLSDMATLEVGLALYAFTGLIVLMVAAEAVLEPRTIWERFGPQARASLLRFDRRSLVSCHGCGQLVPVSPADEHPREACPRCLAPLHRRKTNALARTWALVLAAAILYVPANLLPVMTVIYFGSGHPDTILSGVGALAAGGMWPVAALVFFASIVVPMAKLLGLSWLLLSVQLGRLQAPRQRTIAYRIIEGVGRWSMIDIFMISILVALVDLGSIATIVPGVGALSFAAVVILTMLAAETFDPRLIWDVREASGERDARARL
jgi:paraquat-inducible protein A